METALDDYKRWFDESNDPDEVELVKTIDQALANQDYLTCPYLDDALVAWKDNLEGLISGEDDQDTITEANDQIKLIDEYFN